MKTKLKVKNMSSNKGNLVPNQFEIKSIFKAMTP